MDCHYTSSDEESDPFQDIKNGTKVRIMSHDFYGQVVDTKTVTATVRNGVPEFESFKIERGGNIEDKENKTFAEKIVPIYHVDKGNACFIYKIDLGPVEYLDIEQCKRRCTGKS